MNCAIYKSPRKADTYLFVACKDDFSAVPDALLKVLGQPIHVMDLELTPERKLARADTAEVLRHLQEQGWYLQMPPKESEEESLH
ncbi:MAG: YcgL domain-containing protein [Candidatus Competibacteraceae bacterium]|nr:YcgL domain-containing protein [Candidatus Competibacteraceae bacterium]